MSNAKTNLHPNAILVQQLSVLRKELRETLENEQASPFSKRVAFAATEFIDQVAWARTRLGEQLDVDDAEAVMRVGRSVENRLTNDTRRNYEVLRDLEEGLPKAREEGDKTAFARYHYLDALLDARGGYLRAVAEAV